MILALLLAAAAPVHPHAQPPKPKPPAKIEWIKEGEKIIMVPHPYDPETKYNPPPPDWDDAKWDPYVWA